MISTDVTYTLTGHSWGFMIDKQVLVGNLTNQYLTFDFRYSIAILIRLVSSSNT